MVQEDTMRFLNSLSSTLLITVACVACSNDATVAEGNTDTESSLARSNVAPDTTPDISDTDYAAFVASANEFGLDLAQETVKLGALDKTKNAVFSPVSALTALAMAYAGAEGNVEAAMKVALHDELAAKQYHVAQNRLMRELQSYNYSGLNPEGKEVRVDLAPANSLWAEKTVGIKTPFLDTLSSEYDAGVYLVDFKAAAESARLKINGWVEEKTHNKIKELLLPPDVDSSTRFVLVNALYMYANWMNMFFKTSTLDGTFTNLAGDDVKVSMMHQTESMLYKSADNYEIVQIPYVNGQLHLTIVVPKSGQFEAVRSAVTADWLSTANSGLVSERVALGMPKFKIETAQIKLMGALNALGLFDAGAILTGISGQSAEPVEISEVIQKAFIGTDESGTEAAAATAVMTVGVGMPTDTINLTLDRPFLFFIQAESGLVLFSGHVVDPTN
jgi:serpin B